MKLLHIDSSILGENSATRAITGAVVEAFAGADVTYRDLAAEPIPHLSTADLATLADNADLAQFLEADVIVIGAAMYNFSIPSQLKAWIDRILVAGRTFQYGAEGPEGLAGDKQVVIAIGRGGMYSEGQPAAAVEHAETYLRHALGFIGIAPQVIVAEGLALGDEPRAAAMAAALAEAKTVAVAA